jgi:AcrR family transcriptional regulator
MRDRPGLRTAGERRGVVLDAAVVEFGDRGLAGASTVTIAGRAGIAHSYLFKLFGSKVHLFVATTDHVYDRISQRFREAAADSPTTPLQAMADAYRDLLTERADLLVLLHGFAAASDPAVGRTVRQRYTDLYRQVQAVSGADEQRMREFWAHGMLLTVAAAIELPRTADEHPWVAGLISGLGDPSPLGWRACRSEPCGVPSRSTRTSAPRCWTRPPS